MTGGPILFAYDGSDPASAAIRAAGRQLRPGASGIVLTVWEPLGDDSAPTDLEAEMASDAERVAREGAELARAAGFAVEPIVRGGEKIWRDIVAVADETAASLLVLGSHGRSGIARALIGSVVAGVIHHTTRPVLVVRL
jgi:nucleotide-binding universal stress UspA family protein